MHAVWVAAVSVARVCFLQTSVDWSEVDTWSRGFPTLHSLGGLAQKHELNQSVSYWGGVRKRLSLGVGIDDELDWRLETHHDHQLWVTRGSWPTKKDRETLGLGGAPCDDDSHGPWLLLAVCFKILTRICFMWTSLFPWISHWAHTPFFLVNRIEHEQFSC